MCRRQWTSPPPLLMRWRRAGQPGPEWFKVWDSVHDWVQALIWVSFYWCILEGIKKFAYARIYDRLKASLPGLGYHPRMVARLESIPATEFMGLADRKSIQLLLETWHNEACQDDEEYKELKASLVGLGCHPLLLTRLESMPASEFYAAVDSHSLDLLLSKWHRQALKVR